MRARRPQRAATGRGQPALPGFATGAFINLCRIACTPDCATGVPPVSTAGTAVPQLSQLLIHRIQLCSQTLAAVPLSAEALYNPKS
jgi:hypothetical protein